MKITSLFKKLIMCGSAIAFINYSPIPVASLASSYIFRQQVSEKKIQRVCETDKHLEGIIAEIDAKNCGPMPLLKAAHAITSKWLEGDMKPSELFLFKEFKTALEDGRALCKYYSLFTYSNFLHLAEKLGRVDLKDKVRLCSGALREKDEKIFICMCGCKPTQMANGLITRQRLIR